MKTSILIISFLLFGVLNSQVFRNNGAFITVSGKSFVRGENIPIVNANNGKIILNDSCNFIQNDKFDNATDSLLLNNNSSLLVVKDFTNNGNLQVNDFSKIEVYKSLINFGKVDNYYRIEIGN